MNASNDPSSRDGPVGDAFDAYCEAWADGVRLDPERFCREHADCGPDLRQRIDRFLYVAEELRSDSSAQPAESSPEGEAPSAEPGRSLGDFQLVREIGRGGMGVVYEAEQISLARRVALKVLPSHLTLRSETVARFKQESTTASRLRHPGIVEIYSVGEDEGAHYYAMELIEGTPLDRIIERIRAEEQPPSSGAKLSGAWGDRTYVEAVCRLVLQVAEALDYAHRAEVIHRDVKPSNIILRDDGSAVLTDFGLARAENLPSLTVTGEFTGTPHYVSPEQALPGRRAPDHRTDVYSLGVTLYELLTLKRPFDGQSTPEILARIASREPPQPRSLNPLVPRDLETVCLVALERDPDRRYQSARELADDIARFLKFEPVVARPIGFLMRTMRLVRRNPATAALVILSCLVLIGGPLIFGLQQQSAKNRIAAALENSKREAERARREAEISDQACEYLIDLFRMSSPEEARGRMISVREILYRGKANLNTILEEQSVLRARIKEVIGVIFTHIALYKEAEPLLRDAREYFLKNDGGNELRLISSDYNLGHLYLLMGEPDKAERFLEGALEASRRRLGEEHDLTTAIMIDRAVLHTKRGLLEEAESLLLSVLDTQERLLGLDHTDTFNTISKLARLSVARGDHARAEPLFQKALEGRCRILGEDHPDTLSSTRDLILLYVFQGRSEEIEPMCIETYDAHRRLFGDDHPNTLKSRVFLAFYFHSKDLVEEAEHHYVEALAGCRRVLGDEHPNTIIGMTLLASFRHGLGQDEEAEILFDRALEASVRVLGYSIRATWITARKMAQFYFDLDRLEEAEALLLKVLEHIPPGTVQYEGFRKFLERIARAREREKKREKVKTDAVE